MWALLVVSFLACFASFILWTMERRARSKSRESKYVQQKQARHMWKVRVWKNVNVDQKKKRKGKKREKKQPEKECEESEICRNYWLSLSRSFVCCLFVRLAYVLRDKMTSDSCARRYITSKQINWLKLMEGRGNIPFICALPFRAEKGGGGCLSFFHFLLFFSSLFGKQIMQHVHWIVTHKHNWVSSAWTPLDDSKTIAVSLKGRLWQSFFLTLKCWNRHGRSFFVSFAHHVWNSRAKKLIKLFA